jgi:hypothetical protein
MQVPAQMLVGLFPVACSAAAWLPMLLLHTAHVPPQRRGNPPCCLAACMLCLQLLQLLLNFLQAVFEPLLLCY